MPSFILRHIDPQLWAAFTARAAADGLTPKQALLRLIERYTQSTKDQA